MQTERELGEREKNRLIWLRVWTEKETELGRVPTSGRKTASSLFINRFSLSMSSSDSSCFLPWRRDFQVRHFLSPTGGLDLISDPGLPSPVIGNRKLAFCQEFTCCAL